MKKTKIIKLTLNKETISNLNREQMGKVMGGQTEYITCAKPCDGTDPTSLIIYLCEEYSQQYCAPKK